MYATIFTHLIYLIISITVTVWVGRTLFRNGKVFLVEACQNNHELADSINRLLLVGFYLINLGFVILYLTKGQVVRKGFDMIPALSKQIGVVLLVLGAMHFLNMYVLFRARHEGQQRQIHARPAKATETMPPIPPRPITH